MRKPRPSGWGGGHARNDPSALGDNTGTVVSITEGTAYVRLHEDHEALGNTFEKGEVLMFAQGSLEVNDEE